MNALKLCRSKMNCSFLSRKIKYWFIVFAFGQSGYFHFSQRAYSTYSMRTIKLAYTYIWWGEAIKKFIFYATGLIQWRRVWCKTVFYYNTMMVEFHQINWNNLNMYAIMPFSRKMAIKSTQTKSIRSSSSFGCYFEIDELIKYLMAFYTQILNEHTTTIFAIYYLFTFIGIG